VIVLLRLFLIYAYILPLVASDLPKQNNNPSHFLFCLRETPIVSYLGSKDLINLKIAFGNPDALMADSIYPSVLSNWARRGIYLNLLEKINPALGDPLSVNFLERPISRSDFYPMLCVLSDIGKTLKGRRFDLVLRGVTSSFLEEILPCLEGIDEDFFIKGLSLFCLTYHGDACLDVLFRNQYIGILSHLTSVFRIESLGRSICTLKHSYRPIDFNNMGLRLSSIFQSGVMFKFRVRELELPMPLSDTLALNFMINIRSRNKLRKLVLGASSEQFNFKSISDDDIAFISYNFPNIEVLKIAGREITRIGEITMLSKLHHLSLQNTMIVDISCLALLPHLETLELIFCNHIKSLIPLMMFESLVTLEIVGGGGNQKDLEQLISKGINVITELYS
jgi:hypothetical protein